MNSERHQQLKSYFLWQKVTFPDKVSICSPGNSPCVAQADQGLTVLLLHLRCWDYIHDQSYLVKRMVLNQTLLWKGKYIWDSINNEELLSKTPLFAKYLWCFPIKSHRWSFEGNPFRILGSQVRQPHTVFQKKETLLHFVPYVTAQPRAQLVREGKVTQAT